MKVVTIAGARPQFVKAAAFQRAIQEYNLNPSQVAIQEVLVHTGQHYDINMSDIFFQQMGLTEPNYHLGIGGVQHGAATGRMLEKIEEVLVKEKPDWVVVFGDTNSTVAGALAAVKLHIPIAHVEAGLRSFNRKMPEEINRIVSDQCADLLFTPTAQATKQLLKEGIPERKISEVGDLMYDIALHFQKVSLKEEGVLARYGLTSKQYALLTLHRAENTDQRSQFYEIIEGLISISKQIPVVFPIHPRTAKVLKEEKLENYVRQHLHIIDPVGYVEMITLTRHAQVVLTDSGGLQKEAYFFQVPCITLRTETEWIELIDHGFNVLAPLDKDAILATYERVHQKTFSWGIPLYGDGESGKKMIQELVSRQ